MVKLILALVAVSVLCRWALGKWPWAFLQSPSARKLAVVRARNLLGVDAGAGRDDVIAAHRRLVTLVHPDKGGSTVAMQEANAARDLLLEDLPGAPPARSDDDFPPTSRS